MSSLGFDIKVMLATLKEAMWLPQQYKSISIYFSQCNEGQMYTGNKSKPKNYVKSRNCTKNRKIGLTWWSHNDQVNRGSDNMLQDGASIKYHKERKLTLKFPSFVSWEVKSSDDSTHVSKVRWWERWGKIGNMRRSRKLFWGPWTVQEW